jgi:hypothetical protein
MKSMALALLLLGSTLAGCVPMAGLAPLPPEEPSTSRPELRWKPLPVAAFAPRFAVDEVRYDLRVYHDSALVYSRDGLLEPRHRIEMALTPGQTYSWTVRARFRVDGSRRRTDWTQKDSSARRDGNVVQAPAVLVPLPIEPLPDPSSRRQSPRTFHTRGN